MTDAVKVKHLNGKLEEDVKVPDLPKVLSQLMHGSSVGLPRLESYETIPLTETDSPARPKEKGRKWK